MNRVRNCLLLRHRRLYVGIDQIGTLADALMSLGKAARDFIQGLPAALNLPTEPV